MRNLIPVAAYPQWQTLGLGPKHTVLVRVELNVSMERGEIQDDFRLQRQADSLKPLLATGAKLVLLGHRGRPGGKRIPGLSLQPLAQPLSQYLGTEIQFLDDCIGRMVQQRVKNAPPGSVFLLENVRFHPAEYQEDAAFAKQLAQEIDFFINDAFAVCHRNHTSITQLPQLLPSAAGPGLLQELSQFAQRLSKPNRPLFLIVGGQNLGLKLPILANGIFHADQIMLGGVVANTVLVAKDYKLGRSTAELDYVEPLRDILVEAGIVGCRIQLPQDFMVAPNPVVARASVKRLGDIAKDDTVMDLGPETVKTWVRVLQKSATVIWTGPLGVTEFTPFHEGTGEVANAILHHSADYLVGGQNTVTCLQHLGIREQFRTLSTGGAAFSALLGGQLLPGLQALLGAPITTPV